MQVIQFDPKETKRKKAPAILPQEWQRYKTVVSQLHQGGSTVGGIAKYLREERGFEPTSRQLWSQMNKWGFTRYTGNFASNEYEAIQLGEDFDSIGLGVPRLPFGYLPRFWNPLKAAAQKHAAAQTPDAFQVYSFQRRFESEARDSYRSLVRSCSVPIYDRSDILDVFNQVDHLCSPFHRRAMTFKSRQEAPVSSWMSQYGRILKIIRKWLTSIEKFDKVVLAWIFLFVYELAFTTSLAAKYGQGCLMTIMEDSQRHLEAASRFLDMMAAFGYDPEEKSLFTGIYRDFHKRLAEFDICQWEPLDGFWKRVVLVHDPDNPRIMRTRSRAFEIERNCKVGL